MTTSKPPTATELREIIEQHAEVKRLPDPWDFASAYAAAVQYIPEDEIAGGFVNRVWADLRVSESERFDEILDEAYELATARVKALQAAVREDVIAACLRFAAEYPDAPRARIPQPV